MITDDFVSIAMVAARKIVDPLTRRILHLVARGVVKATQDDKALLRAQVQLLSNELLDGIDAVGHYGFASRPLDGAEAVTLFLGGERGHGIVIATEDRRYRLKAIAKGEVALYTDEGDKIHLKRSGNIEVTAGTKVKVTAPTAQFTGNVQVDGNLTVGGSESVTGSVSAASVAASGAVTGASGTFGGLAVSTIKNTFNAHTHNENGTGGGVTNAPNTSL